MKLNNSLIITLTFLFAAVFCSGCSMPRKVVENTLGNYMDGLNNDDVSSLSQIFTYEIDDCFEKILAIVKDSAIDSVTDVVVLKIDRRNYSMLILVSREPSLEDVDSIFDADGADVGIFLSSVGPDSTRVELRSLSSVIADHTAVKLFPELQKQN
jgi:hypothetical protein